MFVDNLTLLGSSEFVVLRHFRSDYKVQVSCHAMILPIAVAQRCPGQGRIKLSFYFLFFSGLISAPTFYFYLAGCRESNSSCCDRSQMCYIPKLSYVLSLEALRRFGYKTSFITKKVMKNIFFKV